MQKKTPEVLRIAGMVYWRSGDVLGTCDKCSDDGFSYNEDGQLLCKRHIYEYHHEEFDEED